MLRAGKEPMEDERREDRLMMRAGKEMMEDESSERTDGGWKQGKD